MHYRWTSFHSASQWGCTVLVCRSWPVQDFCCHRSSCHRLLKHSTRDVRINGEQVLLLCSCKYIEMSLNCESHFYVCNFSYLLLYSLCGCFWLATTPNKTTVLFHLKRIHNKSSALLFPITVIHLCI